ncbi:hypothetical protein ANCDUO_01449 [Ancylostoma duodenale]|uniref:Uncharacterized protein n=1 Tax=Ancylostoma duodenale TaxID=51022 RepID=A0A0C2DYV5_9BILA|nr:hypothetical protein ANCDUO_01449 [Ancylostoma duodenale]
MVELVDCPTNRDKSLDTDCWRIYSRFSENRALAKTPWRIYRDDFRVINEDEVRSMLSLGSTRTKLSNQSSFAKHHAVLGTNTHASFHVYPQRRPITFNRADMQLLTLVLY